MTPIELGKMLANPLNQECREGGKIPDIGQKVLITNDFAFNKEEVRQLVKLNDTVTVSEVHPRMEGTNGKYVWKYDIYCKEFPDSWILAHHYEFGQ